MLAVGYVDIPDNTLIEIEDAYQYPDNQMVIAATGSQGEAMASLSRMSTGIHKYIDITSNDVVILSATPILGNEKDVANVINRLSERHAHVLFQDTHVSGHACQEEIKLIYSLIKPKFAIPVHGDYRQRNVAKEVIDSLHISNCSTLMLKDGDILTLTSKLPKVTGSVPCGEIMIDLLDERMLVEEPLKIERSCQMVVLLLSV